MYASSMFDRHQCCQVGLCLVWTIVLSIIYLLLSLAKSVWQMQLLLHDKMGGGVRLKKLSLALVQLLGDTRNILSSWLEVNS